MFNARSEPDGRITLTITPKEYNEIIYCCNMVQKNRENSCSISCQ